MAGSDINVREFTVVGELSEDCSSLIIHHFRTMKRIVSPLKGKTLEISFKVLRANRSAAQNRYMWGVVVPTVKAWKLENDGVKWTKDETYAWLRMGLLGHKAEIKDLDGVQVIIMTGKRFSKMNTVEFNEAIESIRQQMAEKGCDIPEPRENNYLSDFLKDSTH